MPQIVVESFEVLKFIFSWGGRATKGSSCWLNRKKDFKTKTCNE